MMKEMRGYADAASFSGLDQTCDDLLGIFQLILMDFVELGVWRQTKLTGTPG